MRWFLDMKQFLTRQFSMSFLFAVGFFSIFVLQINAQQNKSQTSSQTQTAEEVKTADIAITANVTAKELKFEVAPNPTVEFPGTPERKTVWEADRQNLPRPVEPGVTYRNIGIQLRITSRFADIERIVSEALGEIPVSENTPTTSQKPASQNPSNQPNAPTNQNLPPQ